jgi:hypothetical protein
MPLGYGPDRVSTALSGSYSTAAAFHTAAAPCNKFAHHKPRTPQAGAPALLPAVERVASQEHPGAPGGILLW